MPTLTIRNIPAELYDRLKERARRNRRSTTQEAAVLIERALEQAEAGPDPFAEVSRVREALRARYGSFPDSVDLVREDRDR
jgi:plasmid stability protein